MIRERLEALPFDDLKAVAEREGIDVPDEVEKILLIDLILEVIEENRIERELSNNSLIRIEQKKYNLADTASLVESAPADTELPRTYQQTRVVLLLRDPFWAFVYWDIKNTYYKSVKKEINGDGLILRVIRLSDAEGTAAMDYFDIPIQQSDCSWYINIPHQGSFYRVELIVVGRGAIKEKILEYSNSILVPEIVIDDASRRAQYDSDPIIKLSGWDELEVTDIDVPVHRRIKTIDEDIFPA